MNNILKGNWNQLKGQVQKSWGKLTNDDMDQIQGNYNLLVGKLQEKYGYSKVQAQQEVDNFLAKNQQQQTH